jgi:hypothetical protein
LQPDCHFKMAPSAGRATPEGVTRHRTRMNLAGLSPKATNLDATVRYGKPTPPLQPHPTGERPCRSTHQNDAEALSSCRRPHTPTVRRAGRIPAAANAAATRGPSWQKQHTIQQQQVELPLPATDTGESAPPRHSNSLARVDSRRTTTVLRQGAKPRLHGVTPPPGVAQAQHRDATTEGRLSITGSRARRPNTAAVTQSRHHRARRCRRLEGRPPSPLVIEPAVGGGWVREHEHRTCPHGRRHHMAATVTVGAPTAARSRSGPRAARSTRMGSGSRAPPLPSKGRQDAAAPILRPRWHATEKGPRRRRPWGPRGCPAGPSGGGREGGEVAVGVLTGRGRAPPASP